MDSDRPAPEVAAQDSLYWYSQIVHLDFGRLVAG